MEIHLCLHAEGASGWGREGLPGQRPQAKAHVGFPGLKGDGFCVVRTGLCLKARSLFAL